MVSAFLPVCGNEINLGKALNSSGIIVWFFFFSSFVLVLNFVSWKRRAWASASARAVQIHRVPICVDGMRKKPQAFGLFRGEPIWGRREQLLGTLFGFDAIKPLQQGFGTDGRD